MKVPKYESISKVKSPNVVAQTQRKLILSSISSDFLFAFNKQVLFKQCYLTSSLEQIIIHF